MSKSLKGIDKRLISLFHALRLMVVAYTILATSCLGIDYFDIIWCAHSHQSQPFYKHLINKFASNYHIYNCIYLQFIHNCLNGYEWQWRVIFHYL